MVTFPVRRFVRAGAVWGAAALLAHALSAAAAEPPTVKVGTPSAASNAPLYVAAAKGYFAEQGIKVEFIEFNSINLMMAPLGRGELDVGAGGVSPGPFNAVERGIPIKAVADKGSLPPGSQYLELLVRKDLVESGRYRSERDLKGMRIAEAGVATDTSYALAMMAKAGGLTYDDFTHQSLAFPEHVAILQNRSVDGTVSAEPIATRIIDQGLGEIVTPLTKNTPDLQITVLLYSEKFAADRDLAQRFMNAYVEGVRYYKAAVVHGHLTGSHADEVIGILTKYTQIKDAAVYRHIWAPEVNGDGRMNLDSMRDMLRWFQLRGLVKSSVRVGDLVDSSFVDAAVTKLGPWKAAALNR